MSVAETQSNLASIQQAKTKYISNSASNLNKLKETKANSIKAPAKPIYFKQHSLSEHDYVRQFHFYSPNSKYDQTNELYSASNPWQNLTKTKFNQIQSVINKKFDSFDEHSHRSSPSRNECMKACPIKVAKLSLYETLLNKDKFSSTTSIPTLEDGQKSVPQAHRESPSENHNIVFYVSVGPSSAKYISKSHFEKFKQAETANKNVANKAKPIATESSSSMSKIETSKSELKSTTESNIAESTFKEELNNESQGLLTESHDSFSWNIADKPRNLTSRQRNTLVRTYLTESEILQKENEKFKRMRKLMMKNGSKSGEIDMETAATGQTSDVLPNLNVRNESKSKHKKHKPVNLKNFEQLPLIKRHDISNRMETALKYTKQLEHRLFFDSSNQSPHNNANSHSIHNNHKPGESSLVELKFPNLQHQPAQSVYFSQNKQ